MRSRLWTRKFARNLLICLILLTAALAILGILVKRASLATSIVLIVLQVPTAIIALYMPPDLKEEARRKMQAAMTQYVILRSLGTAAREKNKIINRMRELAPKTLYDPREVEGLLDSPDMGERFAGIAHAQWQWRSFKAWNDMNFGYCKKPRELPEPTKDSSSEYFQKLLDVLCDSWDEFENYHATVAMWSMVDSLGTEDKHKLFRRVLDRSEGPLGRTCKKEEWDKFIQDLKDKRNSLVS